MGTTQRINPGVANEPNWGDLSNSITYVASTVEQERKLEEEEKREEEKEKEREKKEENQQPINTNTTKRYAKIENRRGEHIKSAYRNLVKTGGGRQSITSGKSSSIGKAGFKSANRIASLLSGVGTNGKV